ncbi:MAG: hypothetical protein AB7E80_05440 [Hyphomicrobiaceae bacterium]
MKIKSLMSAAHAAGCVMAPPEDEFEAMVEAAPVRALTAERHLAAPPDVVFHAPVPVGHISRPARFAESFTRLLGGRAMLGSGLLRRATA